MKWGRILVAGIGTSVAVLLIITLVVTGYAFKLAFEIRGAPDQTRLAQFAQHLGRSSWWVLQVLLTGPAAAWGVRRLRNSRQLGGVLIGLVVAVTGLAMGLRISVRAIAVFALTVGAGWLGGAIAAHGRNDQAPRRSSMPSRMP